MRESKDIMKRTKNIYISIQEYLPHPKRMMEHLDNQRKLGERKQNVRNDSNTSQ